MINKIKNTKEGLAICLGIAIIVSIVELSALAVKNREIQNYKYQIHQRDAIIQQLTATNNELYYDINPTK